MGAKGICLAEEAHIVPVVYPVDITGGVTGVEFSMENYAHATIILTVGVSAAAWTKIIVNECTSAAGANATGLAHSIYKCETADSDVLGARTAVAAAGTTPSANNSIMYVIEIDAAELTAGYHWIQLSLTNGANSVIAAATAILTGARYGYDQSATAVA